ncbi:MAG TPA: hypothetical protein VFC19_03920 [Candidatus Limnocylindrales bacterium]|nr:hypothetical protein [Candidatus Limnocylindrales bacterium]
MMVTQRARARLATLRQFALCMRQHGFEDFPDPKPNGDFRTNGTSVESEPLDSARWNEAMLACGRYSTPGVNLIREQ